MVVQSRKNPRVLALRALLEQRRARAEHGLFVCEGMRLCLEAAESGIEIPEVWMTFDFMEAHPGEAERLCAAAAETVTMAPPIAQKIAGTVSPQGIFCVCRALDNKGLSDTIKDDGLVVGFEHLQDPGNLGTALRCALALGFDAAVLIGDCADPFSPKALRASMGASFRLPLCAMEQARPVLEHCRRQKIETFAAVVRGGKPVTGLRLERGVLLIGNEARGLCPETAEAASCRLTIPMPGGAESLNAAAAATILMWEMAKNRIGSETLTRGETE